MDLQNRFFFACNILSSFEPLSLRPHPPSSDSTISRVNIPFIISSSYLCIYYILFSLFRNNTFHDTYSNVQFHRINAINANEKRCGKISVFSHHHHHHNLRLIALKENMYVGGMIPSYRIIIMIATMPIPPFINSFTRHFKCMKKVQKNK